MMGRADPGAAELSVTDYAHLGSLADYLRLAAPDVRVARSPGRAGTGDRVDSGCWLVTTDRTTYPTWSRKMPKRLSEGGDTVHMLAYAGLLYLMNAAACYAFSPSSGEFRLLCNVRGLFNNSAHELPVPGNFLALKRSGDSLLILVGDEFDRGRAHWVEIDHRTGKFVQEMPE
jgi:hypothetical protein